MPYLGAEPDKGNFSDLNGGKLIIDADADTSITADTDDQIDIEIAGADDFRFTANNFNVLSGSTLTIDSGATITNSGTASGFGGSDPSSADGDSLGTASAEWSDLYLADGGVIYFGNDQDITLTHVADTGLDLKRTAGDNRYAELTLQTGESDVAVNDLLGKLSFQAPNEGTGTDAILVAAAIQAISEGDFSSSNNATSLQFLTGASEAAAAKMSVTSGGDVKVLTDGASAFFGADSEVELRHVADTGLILKHTATADNKPIVLTLQTGETDMAADDVLGKIDFQAPDEGTGTDAILVSGSIQVVSEGNFSSSANATSMKFFTGNSAAAGSDGGSLILNSTGDLTLKDLRTADGSSPTLTLQTGDTNIAQDDVLGRIAFQAPDEGAGTDALLVGAAIQAVSEGDFSSSNNATKLEFQTGSSEAATTQMTISSAGIVGIGGTLPGDLGVGLHIKTSDSGASVAAAEDELVLESASDVGMALLGGTSSTASIVFGDSSLARSGRILYHLANDTIDFLIGNVTPWHYRANGRTYIRDTSDATSTIGLTLNQLANDDQIFGLKSSDVAHGVTGSMETDTFFNIQKNGGAAGGTYISSFAENNYNQGLAFNVYAGDPHTTKDNDGYTGTYTFYSASHATSAGSVQNMPANSNIFAWLVRESDGGARTIFILDEDGDLHVDGSTSVSAFDEYEDAHITRALDLTHGKGVIDSKFDKFISYNHEKLAELQLVGRKEDGTPNHFVNVTGLQRLHNGAIWQQYEKHQNLLNAVYELAVKAVGEDEANEILDNNEIKLLSKNELLN